MYIKVFLLLIFFFLKIDISAGIYQGSDSLSHKGVGRSNIFTWRKSSSSPLLTEKEKKSLQKKLDIKQKGNFTGEQRKKLETQCLKDFKTLNPQETLETPWDPSSNFFTVSGVESLIDIDPSKSNKPSNSGLTVTKTISFKF